MDIDIKITLQTDKYNADDIKCCLLCRLGGAAHDASISYDYEVLEKKIKQYLWWKFRLNVAVWLIGGIVEVTELTTNNGKD